MLLTLRPARLTMRIKTKTRRVTELAICSSSSPVWLRFSDRSLVNLNSSFCTASPMYFNSLGLMHDQSDLQSVNSLPLNSSTVSVACGTTTTTTRGWAITRILSADLTKTRDRGKGKRLVSATDISFEPVDHYEHHLAGIGTPCHHYVETTIRVLCVKNVADSSLSRFERTRRRDIVNDGQWTLTCAAANSDSAAQQNTDRRCMVAIEWMNAVVTRTRVYKVSRHRRRSIDRLLNA